MPGELKETVIVTAVIWHCKNKHHLDFLDLLQPSGLVQECPKGVVEKVKATHIKQAQLQFPIT